MKLAFQHYSSYQNFWKREKNFTTCSGLKKHLSNFKLVRAVTRLNQQLHCNILVLNLLLQAHKLSEDIFNSIFQHYNEIFGLHYYSQVLNSR